MSEKCNYGVITLTYTLIYEPKDLNLAENVSRDNFLTALEDMSNQYVYAIRGGVQIRPADVNIEIRTEETESKTAEEEIENEG